MLVMINLFCWISHNNCRLRDNFYSNPTRIKQVWTDFTHQSLSHTPSKKKNQHKNATGCSSKNLVIPVFNFTKELHQLEHSTDIKTVDVPRETPRNLGRRTSTKASPLRLGADGNVSPRTPAALGAQSFSEGTPFRCEGNSPFFTPKASQKSTLFWDDPILQRQTKAKTRKQRKGRHHTTTEERWDGILGQEKS